MFHCGKNPELWLVVVLLFPQFSWKLCWCFYGIHPLTVHVASQGDRKAAQVYATWPRLTVHWSRTLTPSEQEVWPSREPCSKKVKTEDEADAICRKAISNIAPSTT